MHLSQWVCVCWGVGGMKTAALNLSLLPLLLNTRVLLAILKRGTT